MGDREPFSEDPTRVAVAVIFNKDATRVLVARRATTTHHDGLLEFPGFRVNDGESDGAVLLVGIKEEIGLDIDVVGAIDEVPIDVYGPGTLSHSICFMRCRFLGGEILLNSQIHDEAEWVDVDGLGDMGLTGVRKDIFRRLIDKLSQTTGNGV